MKTMMKGVVLAMIIASPFTGTAQVAGPNAAALTGNQPNETCSSCSGAIWTNTENINIADGIYSTVHLQNQNNCYQSSCYRSRYLTCTSFDFSIPSTAVILGIEVNAKGYSNNCNAVLDSTIKLCKANVLGGNNKASSCFWAMTNTDRQYGSSTSLWGSTWAPQDINDAGFGVYLKLYNTDHSSANVYVDVVSITVSYSLGTAVFSQTESSNMINVIHNENNLQVNFKIPQGSIAAQVNMFDINGKICYSSIVNSLAGDVAEVNIGTEALNPSIYFIRIIAGDHSYTQKILISNQ